MMMMGLNKEKLIIVLYYIVSKLKLHANKITYHTMLFID